MTGARDAVVLARWLPAATAAAAAAIGWRVASRAASRQPAPPRQWARTNYAGRPVSLLEGPAAVLAVAAGVGLAAGSPRRGRFVVLVAGVGAVGWFDDVHGTSHARGLGGHLRALRDGRVTTGLLKLLGITALAVLLAPVRRPLGRRLESAALISVLANLVNLFDLRPGRALKVVAALTAPLIAEPTVAAPLAAAVLGAVAGVTEPDLHERGMLGDCGANALGAASGWLWASRGGRRAGALLGVAVGLTLLSERFSFSRVIDATPALRWLDGLGRHH